MRTFQRMGDDAGVIQSGLSALAALAASPLRAKLLLRLGVPALVLTVSGRLPSDASVQTLAFQVLSALTESEPFAPRVVDVQKAGARAVAAMALLKESRAVQESGFHLLAELIRKSPARSIQQLVDDGLCDVMVAVGDSILEQVEEEDDDDRRGGDDDDDD
jgi:hypothetical protein